MAGWLSKDPNTKSIYFFDESNWRPIGSCISFVSDGSTIQDLEYYLLVILSQFDPLVLICNQFQNDYMTACNTRYSLMCDLAPAEITTSTPIPATKNENDAFFKKVDKLILKDKQNAFKLVKKTYKWVTDERYI